MALQRQIFKCESPTKMDIKATSVEITKRLAGVYKKPGQVHPHILHLLDLLTDTIFYLRPDLLTKIQDKCENAETKNAKENLDTVEPILDKEVREDIKNQIIKIREMITKHREIVNSLEKDAKTFNTLKQRIEKREEVIRQSCEKSARTEKEIEGIQSRDIYLRFHRSVFDIWGFNAAKNFAIADKKKSDLEAEMTETEANIFSAIDNKLGWRIAQTVTILAQVHSFGCIPVNNLMKIQQNMLAVANNLRDIKCDIIESNSKQYRFTPSAETNAISDFIKNSKDLKKFLNGITLDELNWIKPAKSETDTLGILKSDIIDCSRTSYKNAIVKLDQQNSNLVKFRQKLANDNVGFGWTKPSKFSLKKKWGFFLLSDAVDTKQKGKYIVLENQEMNNFPDLAEIKNSTEDAEINISSEQHEINN